MEGQKLVCTGTLPVVKGIDPDGTSNVHEGWTCFLRLVIRGSGGGEGCVEEKGRFALQFAVGKLHLEFQMQCCKCVSEPECSRE